MYKFYTYDNTCLNEKYHFDFNNVFPEKSHIAPFNLYPKSACPIIPSFSCTCTPWDPCCDPSKQPLGIVWASVELCKEMVNYNLSQGWDNPDVFGFLSIFSDMPFNEVYFISVDRNNEMDKKDGNQNKN